MSTYQGIRVTSSTTGSPSPFEHLSGGYEWRKVPGWTGGNIPEAREESPPPFTAGGAAIREIRAARIARFAGVLAGLGYPDPETAPAAAVIEAGKRVNVGERTARKYRAALLKQQQEGGVS